MAAQIDAVPFLTVERKARDQRLALLAGFFDPDVAATGDLGAVAHFGDDAFKAKLAGMLVHVLAIDLEAVAELDSGAVDDVLELGLTCEQRELSQAMAVQIKQVECDKDDLG